MYDVDTIWIVAETILRNASLYKRQCAERSMEEREEEFDESGHERFWRNNFTYPRGPIKVIDEVSRPPASSRLGRECIFHESQSDGPASRLYLSSSLTLTLSLSLSLSFCVFAYRYYTVCRPTDGQKLT